MAIPRIQDLLKDSFETTVQKAKSGEFVRFMHGLYKQLAPSKRSGDMNNGPYVPLRQYLQDGTSPLSPEVIALNMIQAGLVDHARNSLAYYKQRDVTEKIFSDPRVVNRIALDSRRVKPQETFESRYGIQPRTKDVLGGESNCEDYLHPTIDDGSD